MAEKVLMPKLGMTMLEGTIEQWKVREGDAVTRGQVIVSVATDKLTSDVEAPRDGVVLQILAGEGDSVPVSSVVAYIGDAGEAVPGGDATGEAPPEGAAVPAGMAEVPPAPAAAPADEAAGDRDIKVAPAARKLARELGVGLSLVSGSGPSGRIRRADVEAFAEAQAQGGGAVPVRISPTADKIARDKGIDVGGIDVGGRRIMRDDVLAAAATSAPIEAAATPGDNDHPPVRVGSVRRSIAQHMTESWHTSPMVSYTHPVDCTALMALRSSLRKSFEADGLKLSYNHILIKIAAQALMEFPDVNASFGDDQLVRHVHANVGLAVARGDGLIVPNVKRAETKTLREIARETEDLVAAIREETIDMDSITGGTFTISNLGFYGVTSFSPIINQPELAILGVSAIVDTPVVREGAVVIRPMMNLCLTADHRMVDGVMASRFLLRIVELVEHPYLLLA